MIFWSICLDKTGALGSRDAWNREYLAAALSRVIKQSDPAEEDTLVDALIEKVGEPSASCLRRFQLVTQDQLKCLDPNLVTVGSHSHSHPQLSRLDEDVLASELKGSKELLEKWTGRTKTHFSNQLAQWK